MSDMSFKQAKELVERVELSELTLKNSAQNLEKATKNFNNTLTRQENIMQMLPVQDKKINNLKLLIVLHIGFIVGFVVAAYLFK